MSFAVFLQAFRHGDAATADGAAAFAILGSRIADRGEGWARVRTADGEADVYGIDDPPSGLMVNHAAGDQIWDVVYDLALAGGYAVVPVGCPTCITSDDVRRHLPEGIAESAIVVGSGDEIGGARVSTAGDAGGRFRRSGGLSGVLDVEVVLLPKPVTRDGAQYQNIPLTCGNTSVSCHAVLPEFPPFSPGRVHTVSTDRR